MLGMAMMNLYAVCKTPHVCLTPAGLYSVAITKPHTRPSSLVFINNSTQHCYHTCSVHYVIIIVTATRNSNRFHTPHVSDLHASA